MSAEHLFLSMKVIKAQLNTAVDSDLGCDGAEFNSVCRKYSQSLQFFFLSNMDKVFYN